MKSIKHFSELTIKDIPLVGGKMHLWAKCTPHYPQKGF